MAEIPLGTRREKVLLVTAENAINFLGIEGGEVLSTPQMIGAMERNCRDLALPLLPPGHDTVGTHVNVYHLAAAPIGMAVTFAAEVTAVDGRRIEFKVEARTELQKIGEGTHQRTVIDVAKFAARQAAKRDNRSV
jgi:fluoroacetyl-CoA thioesterase